MSVTIVSAPPQPTQAAATDASNASVSDPAAPLPDFASLLLGQLLPIVTDILPPRTVQKDAPEADAAAADSATLLSVLGIVAPEPARSTETPLLKDAGLPDRGQVGGAIADALAAPKTTVVQDLKPDVKAEPANTEQLPAKIAAADDKPAKFAVASALAPVIEVAIRKSAAPENAPNTVAALPVNANSVPIKHEVSVAVATPLRDQNWAADFAQRIVWLASADKQSAQLTLNPPQMGPIEISLSLDKGNATASFVSANAEVRDAIETALPRLREMFASAGIELGQTNVSAESFKQQAGSSEGHRSASQWRSDNAILVADTAGSETARASALQQGSGMVDIFA